MDTSLSRNSSWQHTWWARALGVAVLVGLSLTPVEAQESYRSETHFLLQNASVELARQSPDFHNVFDNLDAALNVLHHAISIGALDGEQGAAWMDRVTAIAGQVASDELDDTGSTLQKHPQQKNTRKHLVDESMDTTKAKKLLLAGDAARADGEYQLAVRYYRLTLPAPGRLKEPRRHLIPSFGR